MRAIDNLDRQLKLPKMMPMDNLANSGGFWHAYASTQESANAHALKVDFSICTRIEEGFALLCIYQPGAESL